LRIFYQKVQIVNGSSVTKAKRLKESTEKNKLVKKAIPEAWGQLIEEPDEMLLEILADKVESICGHIPDLESLSDFLLNVGKASFEKSSEKKISSRPIQKNMNSKISISSIRKKGVTISIGAESISAETVGDLYSQALKYLVDNKYIENVENQIPFATSSRRFLISKEPIHQRGNGFRSPIDYNGYFMESHKNYEQALKQLAEFVKECGLIMKSESL